MTPSENEPTAFGLVAQCLNQLRPRVPLLNTVHPQINKPLLNRRFSSYICQICKFLDGGDFNTSSTLAGPLRKLGQN